MRKALVMCFADSSQNPRPNRMIHYLIEQNMNVSVLATGDPNIEGVNYFSLATPPELAQPSGKRISKKIHNVFAQLLEKRISRKIHNVFARLFTRNPFPFLTRFGLWMGHNRSALGRVSSSFFERRIWSESLCKQREFLSQMEFDLIVTHGVNLLPLALSIKKKAKVILDAEEYYPQNFADRYLWRKIEQPFKEYLVSRYIAKCDRVLTVSPGFAEAYEKNHGVKCAVFMSLPNSHRLRPTDIDPGHIRLIYHGHANPSRRTHLMIEMMDYVNDCYQLDLMLVGCKKAYLDFLQSLVSRRKNVRLIKPVLMSEIVPFTNQYDIGLFLLQPSNFNLQYTLPNKLFEFIQARLAVAVTPTAMRQIVEKYDCGCVSDGFSLQSMAQKLNALTVEKIMYYKNQSDKAAQELNAEVNGHKIREIVHELIGEEMSQNQQAKLAN